MEGIRWREAECLLYIVFIKSSIVPSRIHMRSRAHWATGDVIRAGHEGIIAFVARCGMLSIGIPQDKSETTSMSAIVLNAVRRMAMRAGIWKRENAPPAASDFCPTI
jgi:hypothetical protein